MQGQAPAQVKEDDQALLSASSEFLQDQSSSLSWVPSYSVSRQGSPLQGSVKLPEDGSLDTLGHDDNPLAIDAVTDPQASVKDAGMALVSEPQVPREKVGNSELPIPVESILQDFTVGDVNNTVQVADPADLEVNTLNVVVGDGENSAQVSCKNTSESTCLKIGTRYTGKNLMSYLWKILRIDPKALGCPAIL